MEICSLLRSHSCSPESHNAHRPHTAASNRRTFLRGCLHDRGKIVESETTLHSVYMQKLWSVWFTVDKKLKIKDYPCTERHAAIFVWFVPSTRRFLVRAVYTVLGSSYLSARKILKTENIGR